MELILLSILAVNIVLLSAVVVSVVRFSRIYSEIYSQFMSFVSPRDGDKPSALAELLHYAGAQAGDEIVTRFKALFMAQLSSDKRADGAIEGDIIEGGMMSNPLLALGLKMFPPLRKTLRRNPALAGLAIEKLSGILGKQGSSIEATPPGNHTQTAFHI